MDEQWQSEKHEEYTMSKVNVASALERAVKSKLPAGQWQQLLDGEHVPARLSEEMAKKNRWGAVETGSRQALQPSVSAAVTSLLQGQDEKQEGKWAAGFGGGVQTAATELAQRISVAAPTQQQSLWLQQAHRIALKAATTQPSSVATLAAARTLAGRASQTSPIKAAVAVNTDPDAQALRDVRQAVEARFSAKAADKNAFNDLLQQAFGNKFDQGKAEEIRQQALAHNFSWMPKVEIMDSAALADHSGSQAAGSALGAYSQAKDTIYLSKELLRGDRVQAQRVLMEEIGHGLDGRLNTSDVAGDEGELFACLMHDDVLSPERLAELKSDNDHGVVQINGANVAVEYGFLKKLGKSLKRGAKKLTQTMANGVKLQFKAAGKVLSGVVTLNTSKIQEGLEDGVEKAKESAKAVDKASREAIKDVHRVAKEGFQRLMQSKLFAVALMVCRFIPIPVVQFVAQIASTARAAYMTYQGIKHKSLSMVVGGVASLAASGAKYAGALGASEGLVRTLESTAGTLSNASMAYNAVAKKDLVSALGLVAGLSEKGSDLAVTAGQLQQIATIGQAVRDRDGLALLDGGLGLAGNMTSEGSKEQDQLAQAREAVKGTRALREIEQGRIDSGLSISQGMAQTNWAGRVAEGYFGSSRSGSAVEAPVDPLEQASPPPDLYGDRNQWAQDNQQVLDDAAQAYQAQLRAQDQARSIAQGTFRQSELDQQRFDSTPIPIDYSQEGGAKSVFRSLERADQARSDAAADREWRRQNDEMYEAGIVPGGGDRDNELPGQNNGSNIPYYASAPQPVRDAYGKADKILLDWHRRPSDGPITEEEFHEALNAIQNAKTYAENDPLMKVGLDRRSSQLHGYAIRNNITLTPEENHNISNSLGGLGAVGADNGMPGRNMNRPTLIGKPAFTKRERLDFVFNDLGAAKPASNPKEARDILNESIDRVENRYSGIPKNQNASTQPNRDDGRMYGVLDDAYVKTNPNGSQTARTKGNIIEFGKNGSIEIKSKDGRTTYFRKEGAE